MDIKQHQDKLVAYLQQVDVGGGILIAGVVMSIISVLFGIASISFYVLTFTIAGGLLMARNTIRAKHGALEYVKMLEEENAKESDNNG